MPTRSGFSFELLFRVAEKTLDPAVEKRVEKAPVEINSDLSRLRHRRPVGEPAGAEERDSFRPSVHSAPERNAESVAAVERRGHACKTIDNDRNHGQLGLKQVQR